LGRCFAEMQRVAGPRQLAFRAVKSELYRVPEGVAIPDSLRGVPVTQDGVEVMGCPIGTPAYVAAWCSRWVASSSRGLAELGRLPDAQSGLTILRECFVSRAVHFLRLMPPERAWLDATAAFDTALWETLQRLLQPPGAPGVPPAPDTSSPAGARQGLALRLGAQQARLPVRRGGLGLASSTALAALSYVCATGRSLPTVLEHFGGGMDPARARAVFAPGWEAALALLPASLLPDIPSLAAFARGYPDRLYQ
jgi:hypothetical protein